MNARIETNEPALVSTGLSPTSTRPSTMQQQAWSRHSEPMSPMYPEEYDRTLPLSLPPRDSFSPSRFADTEPSRLTLSVYRVRSTCSSCSSSLATASSGTGGRWRTSQSGCRREQARQAEEGDDRSRTKTARGHGGQERQVSTFELPDASRPNGGLFRVKEGNEVERRFTSLPSCKRPRTHGDLLCQQYEAIR